jgi:hypothetical protein
MLFRLPLVGEIPSVASARRAAEVLPGTTGEFNLANNQRFGSAFPSAPPTNHFRRGLGDLAINELDYSGVRVGVRVEHNHSLEHLAARKDEILSVGNRVSDVNKLVPIENRNLKSHRLRFHFVSLLLVTFHEILLLSLMFDPCLKIRRGGPSTADAGCRAYFQISRRFLQEQQRRIP